MTDSETPVAPAPTAEVAMTKPFSKRDQTAVNDGNAMPPLPAPPKGEVKVTGGVTKEVTFDVTHK